MMKKKDLLAQVQAAVRRLAGYVLGKDAQGDRREGDRAERVVRIIYCRAVCDKKNALVDEEGYMCVLRIQDALREAAAGERCEQALFVMAGRVEEMLRACVSGAVAHALSQEQAQREHSRKSHREQKGKGDPWAIVFCEVGKGEWLKRWLGCNEQECADESYSPFCVFGADGFEQLCKRYHQ